MLAALDAPIDALQDGLFVRDVQPLDFDHGGALPCSRSAAAFRPWRPRNSGCRSHRVGFHGSEIGLTAGTTRSKWAALTLSERRCRPHLTAGTARSFQAVTEIQAQTIARLRPLSMSAMSRHILVICRYANLPPRT